MVKSKELPESEKDKLFTCLRTAYDESLNMLTMHPSLTADRFQDIYSRHFSKDSFRLLRGTPKSQPQYDQNLYPSLFSDLAILGPEGHKSWNPDQIPSNMEELKEAVRSTNDDSLARVLLAFIWKQGDLNTLIHVFSGFRAGSRRSSAVMWQFGQHLREPLKTPIFDQHTSRSKLLLENFDSWNDKNALLKFVKNSLPKGQKLNDSDMLTQYLTWWTNNIGGKLPTTPPGDRALAILWSDRLMFSLGKAAKGVVAKLSS